MKNARNGSSRERLSGRLRGVRWGLLLAAVLIAAAGCTGSGGEFGMFSSSTASSETAGRSAVPKTDSLPAKGPTAKGHYRGFASADLNNDGHPELVSAKILSGDLVIWHGGKANNWAVTSTLRTGADIRAFDIADLDGDARLDIAIAVRGNGQRSSVQVWRNLGRFRFRKMAGPGKHRVFADLFAIDLNFDGRADLVTASEEESAGDGIQIWLNLGPGKWQRAPSPAAAGPVLDVAVVDLNQDGLFDIVAAAGGPKGGLRVWLGKGKDFRWGAPNLLGRGEFWSVSVQDMNGDDIPDVLATGRNTGIQVWQGLGKGVLNHMASPVAEGSFWRAVAVDRDGDGFMDLVASTMGGEGLRFWRQDRRLGWMAQRFLPTVGMYRGLTVADFDGDGRADLGAATHGEGIPIWPGFGHLKPLSAGAGGQRVKHDLPLIPGATMPERPGAQKARIEARKGIEGAKPEERLPGEYIIGAGDILTIVIWQGIKPQTMDVQVSERGLVSVGFLDDVPAASLTLRELDGVLTRKLARFIKNPRIDVAVKRFGSKVIRVMGTVARPRPVNIAKSITVLDAILLAGGHITPQGSGDLTRVSLQRKGVTRKVNLLRYISGGGQSNNPLLEDGDLIFVPQAPPDLQERQRIFVFGQTRAPGVYPFSFNMRVLDAVARARGFTPFALKDQIRIIRGDSERPEVIQADIKAMLEKGDRRGNLLLKPNDVIYIPRSVIGDLNDFVRQVSPILEFLFFPGRFRSFYALNTNVLKFDVGGPSAAEAERKSGGTFTAGVPTTTILR